MSSPMTNTLTSLSVAQLQRIISIKEQIESLETQLAGILGDPAPVAAPTAIVATAKPAKRFVSAETRARMSAAHQARLAAKNKGAKVVAAAPAAAPKKKGQMSAEGRAAIVAAQKARWAKIKAAKATKAAPKAAVTKVAPAATAKPAAAPRRKISPEGMARIIAATKARWASIRAAKAAGKKR